MPDNNGPDISQYATRQSADYKKLRKGIPMSLKAQVYEIQEELTENPDQYPQRTTSLGQDMFVYNHPQPSINITYKLDRTKQEITFLHLGVPRFGENKSLFINYSDTDEKWYAELRKWLTPLEKDSLIKIWEDTDIKAVEEWLDRELFQRADPEAPSAKVALLLVSQDFLALEFINDLPSLLDKAADEGLTVFRVDVSTSNVGDTDIARYPPVNAPPPLEELQPAKRKKEYLQIYNRIKDEILP